jgi:hypothetical protein
LAVAPDHSQQKKDVVPTAAARVLKKRLLRDLD